MTDELILALHNAFAHLGDILRLHKQWHDNRLGDLNQLNTQAATNLVAALNEVHSLASTKADLDDASNDGDHTWSALKIKTYTGGLIQDLIGEAGPSQDTLGEVAAQITAIMQANQGLVSAAGAQSFTEEEITQVLTNIKAMPADKLGDLTNIDFDASFQQALLQAD